VVDAGGRAGGGTHPASGERDSLVINFPGDHSKQEKSNVKKGKGLHKRAMTIKKRAIRKPEATAAVEEVPTPTETFDARNSWHKARCSFSNTIFAL
jgi:hypothetical protein